MVRAYQIPEEVEKAMGHWLAAFDDNGEQMEGVTDEDVSQRYAALKAIENQKNQVAEWALGEYANLVMSSESLSKESARIAALAASEAKKAERLLSLVRMLVGIDVEEKPAIIANWKVGYSMGTGSLEIDEGAEIPLEFKRYSEQAVTLASLMD